MDFVRSFGSVRKRRLGGLTGWVGESSICEANRALRFVSIPTFQDREGLHVPLKVAFRRLFFDGLAVGKFEVGLGSIPLTNTCVGQKQTGALIKHCLTLPITIPPITNKAVTRLFSEEPTFCHLGQAAKPLARFYAASTLRHPPPVDLKEWWVRPGAPVLFLVHDHSEQFQLPFKGKTVPNNRDYDPAFQLSHVLIPYQGKSLQMWVIRCSVKNAYYWARGLKICLMRLHAEQESLRIVLENIALKRIKPKSRTDASNLLQYYLNEATRKLLGLSSEANKCSSSPDVAEIARQSQAFMNPGERDSLMESLRNLDMRLNIFNKVKDYVDQRIQINELHIKEVRMDTGDEYNISGGQNTGFGRGARVYENVFKQWEAAGSDVSLETLAKELAILRAELKKIGTTSEQDAEVGAVAEAESAAKKGDGAKVFEYLSRAGSWALEIAQRIAVPVAIEALKRAASV